MAQANVKLTVDARSAVSSLNNTTLATNKLSSSAKGTTASLAGTSAAAKGLAASLATTMGPIIALGAAFSTLNSGLRVFSDRQRDVAILRQGLQNLDVGVDVLNRLQKAASKLGDETLFDQEEFTRGFNLLTSFRKIGVDSYEQVAQAAADIAQLNQVDVKTSFMQLAKALEDPERNLATLNRSGISFNKTQTDMIKKLMKANKTAEAHAMILDIVNEAYNKTAQAAATGFAGNVDSLGEAFRDFAEVLGKALVPVIQPAVKGLTALLKFFSSEGGQVTAAIAGAALAFKGLSVVIAATTAQLSTMSIAAAAANGTLAASTTMAFATAGGFAKATAAVTAFKIALAKTGIGLAIVGFGLLATEILKVINAQKEYNQILEEGTISQTNDKIKEYREEIEKLEARIAKANVVGFVLRDWFLSGAGNAASMKNEVAQLEEKIRQLQESLELKEELKLAREFDKVRRSLLESNQELKDIIDRSRLETEEERKQFDLLQRKNELIAKYGEDLANVILKQEEENKKLKEGVDKIKEKEAAAEKLKEKFKEIGANIANGVSDALTDAILQTKTLGEAARNILQGIARDLLKLGINTLLKQFGGPFAALPGFANGGRPPANKPSVVGEKGPEVFVPSSSGTIIPNNELGGSTNTNIVVNVDATGSSVEGDEDEGRALGQMLAAAIQSELIKQRRPGGLLT